MLESCFQQVFGVIRHMEFTFQQICGGTVCNLRFFFFFFLLCRLLVVGPVLISLPLVFTVPTTCSRPSTNLTGLSFHAFSVAGVLARPFESKS